MWIDQINAAVRFPRRLLTLLVVLSTAFYGCKDDENPIITTPPQNINDLVAGSNQFTLLRAAITRAGLGATLSGAGPLTVFAPTDSAFRAAGYADAAAITAAPAATINNLLLYHVVSGSAVTAAAIPTVQTAYPTSVSGNAPIYVSKGTGVSVNGARVQQADVQATNGVVHVINKVLMPPAGTVLAIAQADTTLSFLTAAAMRGGPTLTAALAGPTPLTVFAPTNAAFRLTPYNSLSAINAANPTTLAAVLTNHVLAPARAYSPTLVRGPVTTFGGGSLTVTLGSNNAITLTSPGSATNAATVTTPDINATNGVIHKINRVLLP